MEGSAEGAEAQVVHEFIGSPSTASECADHRNELADGSDCAFAGSGAAQDSSDVESGVLLDDVRHKEGAHAVSEEEEVFAGVVSGDGLAKFDGILADAFPAVFVGEPTEFLVGCREAVATVILYVYGDSKGVEVGCEAIVAAAVLCHAVENL